MWLSFCWVNIPSPLTFLTLQAFCWAYIVSVTNKVDAITVVSHTTQELFQVLNLQFMEVAAPKSLLMLDAITVGSPDGGSSSACCHELPRDAFTAAK